MRNLGLILVALCGSVAGCGGGSTKTQGDLTVAGRRTGEITGQMRVVLAFSRPMVGKDQVARAATSVPLTLSPALTGTATWVDDKTLTFVPTESLPVSVSYTHLTLPTNREV